MKGLVFQRKRRGSVDILSFPEGKKLAMSFGAKFIETSVGIQHNVDELLVGVLKQIRLHEEVAVKRKVKNSKPRRSEGGGDNGPPRSPLHTLQVAREILAKVCLNASSNSSFSKSCENLHVL